MDKLNSNREVLKISDLKKSKIYNIKMLEQLEVGDFTGLKQLSADDRNNRQFMEPLLYAVKNELNTYKVYKYYGENLQGDILRDNKELAVDIVIKEPELIEGTPISRNPQFILEHVQSNPKIIRYMDQHLKTNDIFINELNNKKNPLITAEITRIGLVSEILSNPELSNSKEFMSSVIRKDATFLKYASEELKNDGDFLRNEALQNEDVIKYVADNAEEFGLKGVEGVRESSTDYIISNQEYSQIIDNKAQEEARYKNAKEKIKEHTDKGNKGTATFIAAAVVSQSENVNEEFARRTVNYAILTMETIKHDLSEAGEMKIDLETVKQRRLVTPVVLDRLVQKLEEQGISLDREITQNIDNYKNFYNEYMARVREQIRKGQGQKISKDNVQNATKDAIPDETAVRGATARETDKKTTEITL